MPLAPTKAVLQFSDCSPADSTNAAVNWRDYGRSRWQLSHKITTIAGVHVRGRSTYFATREAASGPSIHLPQRSIIPAIEALSVKTIDQSKNYK
jgi:hypothetical protein